MKRVGVNVRSCEYGNLDEFSILVDKLVKSADTALHLTEEEKCVIVDCAFEGVHKILDRRYKRMLNMHRVNRREI